jgi:uncharacterized protein YecT (DUF1311 family)
MCRSLSRLYKVRHVLCHEIPSKAIYEREEIEGFLKAAAKFAGAIHAALSLLLFGDTPVTMVEMKNAAAKDLSRMNGEIDELLDKLKGGADQEKVNLMARAQVAWLQFREAHCSARADAAHGGSLSELLWLLESGAITKDRVEQLNKWLTEESQ